MTKNQKWIKVSRIEYLRFYLGFVDGVLKGIQEEKKRIKDKMLLEIIEEQEKEWIDYRGKIMDKILECKKSEESLSEVV